MAHYPWPKTNLQTNFEHNWIPFQIEKLLHTYFWKRMPLVFELDRYPAAQITKKSEWWGLGCWSRSVSQEVGTTPHQSSIVRARFTESQSNAPWEVALCVGCWARFLYWLGLFRSTFCGGHCAPDPGSALWPLGALGGSRGWFKGFSHGVTRGRFWGLTSKIPPLGSR